MLLRLASSLIQFLGLVILPSDLAYVKFIEKVRIRSHNAEMTCFLNEAMTIYIYIYIYIYMKMMGG